MVYVNILNMNYCSNMFVANTDFLCKMSDFFSFMHTNSDYDCSFYCCKTCFGVTFYFYCTSFISARGCTPAM